MAEFHFVEDYRKYVRELIAANDIDTAMSLAVGGDWDEVGKIMSKFVQSHGLSSGMKVLDFGCGSGRLAYALSKDIDLHSYVGIDIVKDLLRYAGRKCPSNYKFLINNSLSIQLKDSNFDFAFGFSIFTHLLQTEIMLYSQQIFDLLRPGGTFIYSFIELDHHWEIFESSVIAHREHSRPYPHLNTFMDRNQVALLAEKCGFKLDQFVEPEDGIGQTAVILKKP